MSLLRRALVLGAGGTAGIAWEIGLLAGLAEAGIDVQTADLFVGTSAGSVVAAQITSGRSPEELFQYQVDPLLQVQELAPPLDFHHWHAAIMRAKEGSAETTLILRRVGALALATRTVSQSERRTVIAARLPRHTWPESRLLVVAVDAERGERHVFDRTSGVDLVDAVAASCAVPGMWPAVTIGGQRYMDGGIYSTDNADLAVGSERVLIVTLPPRVPPLAVVPLEAAVQTLQRSGAQVGVVRPDEATEAAFASVGGNLLEPAVRERAAYAGREQGRSVATDHTASLWQ
jgi:NTE family protein